jgi:alkylation response protein AidB-like acyl-CoA dehydrogenase
MARNGSQPEPCTYPPHFIRLFGCGVDRASISDIKSTTRVVKISVVPTSFLLGVDLSMGKTYLIRNDQEALEIADRFARQIETESADRDKHRRLPFHEMELFSDSGLLGMTVPKSYGGPAVSTVTFVKAVALISSADASIGQIPQNHYANVEEIRLVGTEAQKAFFFARILQGERLGNAAVERSGKTILENQTRLVPDGDG